MHGRPSTSLSEAGVLIHLFDALEDWGNGKPWRPCHSGWCSSIADHESCSLVNAELPHLFNGGAGLILRPRLVDLLCSYQADGGTQGKNRGGCGQLWCTPRHFWQCSWPPGQLDQMLETQERTNADGYNEVIVGSARWDQNLPDAIEAIVYVSGGSGRDKARQVRSKSGRETSSAVRSHCTFLPSLSAPFCEAGAR